MMMDSMERPKKTSLLFKEYLGAVLRRPIAYYRNIRLYRTFF